MSGRCVFKCDHDPNSLTNTLPQNQRFRTVMTCFRQQITNYLHNINYSGINNKQTILQQRALGRELGLVIDLTNTTRYYPLSDWTKEGIGHVKIRCKGRDSVPEDESVQKFCNEKPKSLVCPQTPEWKSLPDPDVHDVSFSTTDNRADILQQENIERNGVMTNVINWNM
ncbi:hypothetical protein KIW84_071182 [Lathyrus oleraceus]|uniref:Uncharacterized protein n=1 Tax=Pisum sativum TaxID=3888 RepID=A0A9D4VK00_PEA|nr:hypothetical protein KIW84_071182 [Pisum sativum]